MAVGQREEVCSVKITDTPGGAPSPNRVAGPSKGVRIALLEPQKSHLT